MELSARFRDALAFASQLHHTQARKGSGVPYVAHLLGVCALVLEFGGDEECAVAALLHDAVEDQGAPDTPRRIRELFGGRVASIVMACTDPSKVGSPKPPKPRTCKAWMEGKKPYLAQLRRAGPSVRLVSCCDKLHNAKAVVRDLRHHGEGVWARFNGGRRGTLWYYRALAELYLRKGPGPVAEELQDTVLEMEELARASRG